MQEREGKREREEKGERLHGGKEGGKKGLSWGGKKRVKIAWV